MRSESIAGVVLASGVSRRFGAGNKLLAPVGGEPLIRRTVRAFLHADLDPVVVVLGHQSAQLAKSISGLGARIVPNPDFRQGQSRALVRGISALPADAAAAVIGVADQPFLSDWVIRELIAAHWATGAPIVVPRYAGRRGNPVLLDRVLFAELVEVEGDTGGREVVDRHRDLIAWVDIVDGRLGRDVDTLEDYESLVDASPD